MDDRFNHHQYVIRKKVFKLLGGAFHIYDENEQQVLLYSRQKAFKLKEDIRLYTGEDMQTEVLHIQARAVIDWGASYDVMDALTKERVGSLRRKGFKSMLRDEWVVMNAEGREIGLVRECSQLVALVRRVFELGALLMPQTYHLTLGDQLVGSFKQNRNPFIKKIFVDFRHDTGGWLDRRLGLAAAVLMCAVEGRQG